MNKTTLAHTLSFLLLVVLALGTMPSSASAQTGGTYELTWSTVNGGGATFSTGGTYELGGTLGQPDAETLTEGAYVLGGGFWVNFLGYRILLPLIMR